MIYSVEFVNGLEKHISRSNFIMRRELLLLFICLYCFAEFLMMIIAPISIWKFNFELEIF